MKKGSTGNMSLLLPEKSIELLLFCLFVSFPEPLNTAGRIDQLLFSRIEGMTFIADIDALTFRGRTCFNDIPA